MGNSVTREQLLSISRSTRLYQSTHIIIKCSFCLFKCTRDIMLTDILMFFDRTDIRPVK